MNSSDDQAVANEANEVIPSPIKKNKRGKIVSSCERLIIVNMYKAYLKKDPNMSMRKMRKIISESMGIGVSTVQKTINEYQVTNTVTSPKRKRIRDSVVDLYDDFARNAVRKHIHNIWFRGDIPTIDKIHKAISEDESLLSISRINLYKLLKKIQFHYCKRSQNSALTEKKEIVLWRRRYLRTIQRYREEGRHIYYLDETWVNAVDCPNKVLVDSTIGSHPDAFKKSLTTGAPKRKSGKGKRLIVLHIGSENGFVPGGLLCFEGKKNSRDYHDEMNGQTFYEWMENILPGLPDNSVIVMDNVPYHSVELDRAPTSTTAKADIIEWLVEKGEVIDSSMVLYELLEMVQRIKPLHQKYVIDELAKAHNKTILRLPPNHCELNPIELAWSSVKNHIKMNIATSKLNDVKNLMIEGINRIDAQMWKNFINNTKKEEEKLWQIDCVVDQILATETQNLTLTVSSNTSSDSEYDSDSN